MRRKHRKDKNHGKNGWVGGNPRYGKSSGLAHGALTGPTRQSDKDKNRKQREE